MLTVVRFHQFRSTELAESVGLKDDEYTFWYKQQQKQQQPLVWAMWMFGWIDSKSPRNHCLRLWRFHLKRLNQLWITIEILKQDAGVNYWAIRSRVQAKKQAEKMDFTSYSITQSKPCFFFQKLKIISFSRISDYSLSRKNLLVLETLNCSSSFWCCVVCSFSPVFYDQMLWC